MPYNNIQDGLYLAQQTGLEKNGIPVTHYGIIDIGNILQHPDIDPTLTPTVLHQTPPEIRYEYINGDTPWVIIGTITDIEAAKKRIEKAVKDKAYDLFGNNCEHFARFVATGTKVSGQIIVGGAVAAGGVYLLIQLFKWLKK